MATLQNCWVFDHKNIINIYHNTTTGYRFALLDFKEIPSSSGYSSYLLSSSDKIYFEIDENTKGVIEITNSILGFPSYGCIVADTPLSSESLELRDESFRLRVVGNVTSTPVDSEEKSTWYAIESVRLTDNAKTTVHR
jgi:hypothetical protein